MKVAFIFNSPVVRLFGKETEAVSILFWVFFKEPKNKVPASTIRHEMIHIRQGREEGFLLSSLRYNWQYIVNLLKYKDTYKAYRMISYEQEAYKKQSTTRLTKAEQDEIGWKEPKRK
jgi:hypothetical protein